MQGQIGTATKEMLQRPAKKNEQRIAGWLRLVLPEIELARPHGKLDGIPLVKTEPTRDEIKRKASDENQRRLPPYRHVDLLIGRNHLVDIAPDVDKLVTYLFASSA